MKKQSLLIALLLMPAVAQAWPWSKDMANQISVKPQESPDPANPGMTVFPKRSVPVPAIADLVKDQDAATKLKNPVKADAKSVEAGGRLFNIYCTPCHGQHGKGDGYVGAKLALRPYDLSAEHAQEISDGYIFGMMTFGGAVMPIYAYDLSMTERWHVVNYVRQVIQKSRPADKTSAAK